MKKRLKVFLSSFLGLLIVMGLGQGIVEAGGVSGGWEAIYRDYLSQPANRYENIVEKQPHYKYEEGKKLASQVIYSGYLVEDINFVRLKDGDHPQMVVSHTGVYNYDSRIAVYDIVGGQVRKIYGFKTRLTRNGLEKDISPRLPYVSKERDRILFYGDRMDYTSTIFELEYNQAGDRLELVDKKDEFQDLVRKMDKAYLDIHSPEGFLTYHSYQRGGQASKNQNYYQIWDKKQNRHIKESLFYLDEKAVTKLMNEYKQATEKARPRDIAITIDGQPFSSQIPPINKSGTIMIQFRPIFMELGLEDIEWIGESRQVIGRRPGKEIILSIDKKTALVDGQEIALKEPAMIIDGNTLVPLRFIAESIGAEVEWDQATRTVKINSK